MPTRGQPAWVPYTALSVGTGAPYSNDQANHSLFVLTDDVERVPANAATVRALSAGKYLLHLTAEETNGDMLAVYGTSTSPGIIIVPVFVSTTPKSGFGPQEMSVAIDETRPPSNVTVTIEEDVVNPVTVNLGENPNASRPPANVTVEIDDQIVNPVTVELDEE